jgi:hypothetical protein
MPVYKNETAVAITEEVEDLDGKRRKIKLEPGETKTMEYVLLDAGLTEVNPAPYYNPLMRTQTATSTGVGDDQTVSINRETKKIVIYNSSDAEVTAFLRSTSNTPGLPVPSNSIREIAVGCNVDQLVLQFTASGSVLVEERK